MADTQCAASLLGQQVQLTNVNNVYLHILDAIRYVQTRPGARPGFSMSGHPPSVEDDSDSEAKVDLVSEAMGRSVHDATEGPASALSHSARFIASRRKMREAKKKNHVRADTDAQIGDEVGYVPLYSLTGAGACGKCYVSDGRVRVFVVYADALHNVAYSPPCACILW